MSVSPGGAEDLEKGPAARRRLVREEVLQRGFARVEDLAEQFAVSAMTLHRDLDALQAEGWLVKIRGGATANPAALVEASVDRRVHSMAREKAAIAREGAALLTHAQTVFLDDSTTVLALVEHLLARPPLLVATNFLTALSALRGTSSELQLLGGSYVALQDACQGRQTVEAIARMHADVFFMSTTALSQGRCLHRSEETVTVRQAFLAHSAHNVLLVDHAKFGRPAPHVLCDLSAFNTIVVDDGIDDSDLALLEDSCDDVRVAVVDSP